MFFLSLDTGKEIVFLFHYMHKVPLLSLLQSKMKCMAMYPAWFLYPGVDWDGEDRVKAALIGTTQEMRPRIGSIEPENNQIQVLIRSRAGLEWCEVGSFSNPSLISCVREIPLLQGFHSYRKQFWDVFQAHAGHYWVLLKEMEGDMLQKVEVSVGFMLWYLVLSLICVPLSQGRERPCIRVPETRPQTKAPPAAGILLLFCVFLTS